MLFCEEHIPFFSKEVAKLCLFFNHVERVFLGTPYFAGTFLFVIPFFKSFKALHFTPIGLLFNLRFMCTIFLSQKNKNGFFEFTMLYLCIQKLNARFEKVGMFNFWSKSLNSIEKAWRDKKKFKFCSTYQDVWVFEYSRSFWSEKG